MTTTAKYTPSNKHVVSKRTGKVTVAIVGFATSTRDLAPWDDKDTEIWGLNEAYIVPNFMKRWDRWFQMHSSSNFSRANNVHDSKHYQWLQAQTEFPIYMEHHYKEIPKSIEYPLERVFEMVQGHRYATSTVAYTIALAALEGFERIELYGIEMASDTEYGYQKPCGEFWLGYCIGKGIEIYLPDGCRLLNAPLYGYEQLGLGFRQRVESRKNELRKIKETELIKLQAIDGARVFVEEHLKLKTELTTEKLQEELVRLETSQDAQKAHVNAIAGQVFEDEQILKEYDAYPFEQDRGDSEYNLKEHADESQ